MHSWRASLAYITGAHNMKFGYMGNYLVSDVNNFRPNARLEYRFQNGVPNRLTMRGDNGAKTSNRTQRDQPVCPGTMDPRSADAAGRLTLRPRLELGSGSACGSRSVHSERVRVSQDEGR